MTKFYRDKDIESAKKRVAEIFLKNSVDRSYVHYLTDVYFHGRGNEILSDAGVPWLSAA